MFLFFHTHQTATNTSFHKGKLFEDLLRRHLSASGYEVELRAQKSSSLEYDIVGTHRDDGRPVVGEAKAHEGTISGETVSAFVGKFVIQTGGRNKTGPQPSGLFLSTSPISPDAEDALRKLNAAGEYNINAWYGARLEARIRQSLALPDHDAVARSLQTVLPFVHSQALLHTDTGTYLVAIGSGQGGGLPDRFAVINSTGGVVTDPAFYTRLREGVSSLQEYGVADLSNDTQTTSPRNVIRREIAEGRHRSTGTDSLGLNGPPIHLRAPEEAPSEEGC